MLARSASPRPPAPVLRLPPEWCVLVDHSAEGDYGRTRSGSAAGRDGLAIPTPASASPSAIYLASERTGSRAGAAARRCGGGTSSAGEPLPPAVWRNADGAGR